MTTLSIAPDGETLLAFHTQEDLPDTDPEFAGSWALSMTALHGGFSSPIRLPPSPSATATAAAAPTASSSWTAKARW